MTAFYIFYGGILLRQLIACFIIYLVRSAFIEAVSDPASFIYVNK